MIFGVYSSKYPGKMAVEMTKAYAELAQSKIAQALMVFLLFSSMDIVLFLIVDVGFWVFDFEFLMFDYWCWIVDFYKKRVKLL